MSPAKALRRAGVAILLAASVASLSCSSSDPATPVQDVVGNTYLRATITVLDTGFPCTALSCEPEFFTCTSRQPVAVGTQWTVHAGTVTAGATSDTNWTVTGVDATQRTSIALEMTMAGGPPPVARFTYVSASQSSDATYVDIDTQCDEVTGSGPESRFHLVRATTSSLTMSSLNWNGTTFIPAVSDGNGGFSPESIAEGTFSFVGQVLQPTPSGTITGEVLVEGCYRVNLPRPERGVPVTPTPTSALCN